MSEIIKWVIAVPVMLVWVWIGVSALLDLRRPSKTVARLADEIAELEHDTELVAVGDDPDHCWRCAMRHPSTWMTAENVRRTLYLPASDALIVDLPDPGLTERDVWREGGRLKP